MEKSMEAERAQEFETVVHTNTIIESIAIYICNLEMLFL